MRLSQWKGMKSYTGESDPYWLIQLPAPSYLFRQSFTHTHTHTHTHTASCGQIAALPIVTQHHSPAVLLPAWYPSIVSWYFLFLWLPALCPKLFHVLGFSRSVPGTNSSGGSPQLSLVAISQHIHAMLVTWETSSQARLTQTKTLQSGSRLWALTDSALLWKCVGTSKDVTTLVFWWWWQCALWNS